MAFKTPARSSVLSLSKGFTSLGLILLVIIIAALTSGYYYTTMRPPAAQPYAQGDIASTTANSEHPTTSPKEPGTEPVEGACPHYGIECAPGYHAVPSAGTDAHGCPLAPTCIAN